MKEFPTNEDEMLEAAMAAFKRFNEAVDKIVTEDAPKVQYTMTIGMKEGGTHKKLRVIILPEEEACQCPKCTGRPEPERN